MKLTEEMCDAIAEYNAPEPLPDHFFQLVFIDSEGEEEYGDDTWSVTPCQFNCEECMNEIKKEVESFDLTKECWNNVVEIKVIFQEWTSSYANEVHDVVSIWKRPREVLPIQPPKSAAKDEEVESESEDEDESDEWCECCWCQKELSDDDETTIVGDECVCLDCASKQGTKRIR